MKLNYLENVLGNIDSIDLDDIIEYKILNVGAGLCEVITAEDKLIFHDTGCDGASEKVLDELKINKPKKLELYISHWHDDHYGNLSKIVKYCIDNNIEIERCVVPEPSNDYQIQKLLNNIITKTLIMNYEVENKNEISTNELSKVYSYLFKCVEMNSEDNEIKHDRAISMKNIYSELSPEGKSFLEEKMKILKNDPSIETFRELVVEDFFSFTSTESRFVISKAYKEGFFSRDIKNDDKLRYRKSISDFTKAVEDFAEKNNIKRKENFKINFEFIENPSEFFYKKYKVNNFIEISLVCVNPLLYNETVSESKRLKEEDLLSLNNKSIIFCADMCGNKIVSLGDIELPSEKVLCQLIDDGKLPEIEKLLKEADVLVLAHHGSDKCNKMIYKYLKPECIVIQSDDQDKHKHYLQEVIKNFSEQTILSTDLNKSKGLFFTFVKGEGGFFKTEDFHKHIIERCRGYINNPYVLPEDETLNKEEVSIKRNIETLIPFTVRGFIKLLRKDTYFEIFPENFSERKLYGIEMDCDLLQQQKDEVLVLSVEEQQQEMLEELQKNERDFLIQRN